jgi:hypothetical protein
VYVNDVALLGKNIHTVKPHYAMGMIMSPKMVMFYFIEIAMKYVLTYL